MKRLALPILLTLLCSAAFAQTEYDIPDGTGIEYIFYNVNPPYTNTFFDDFVIVTPNSTYTVNVMMHFTQGNPAATYGSITFTQYSLPGSPSFSESLTNISYTPFLYKEAIATAHFAGTVSGSLLFNIVLKPCTFRCAGAHELTTLDGLHSNFTINPQTAIKRPTLIYRCASNRQDCFHEVVFSHHGRTEF